MSLDVLLPLLFSGRVWEGLVFSSVQLSHSVLSDSLRPHGLQHARPPCPSPTPGVYPNSCPLSWWCHPTISSSVVLLLPLSIFLSIRIFSNESGGQSTGLSSSASVLPMIIQDWFPLGWTGWISLQSKRLSRFSPTPQFKSTKFSVPSFLYGPNLTSKHGYWKNHSFD